MTNPGQSNQKNQPQLHFGWLMFKNNQFFDSKKINGKALAG